MMPFSPLSFRRCACVALILFAQQAFAEETRSVRILDGEPASPSASQPTAPGITAAPALEQAPQPPAPSSSSAPVPPSPSETEIQKPAPAAGSAAPAIARMTTAAPDEAIASAKVANPAEVAVEMLPGQTVSVGSRVSFRVSARKGGYLVLVDIDANGRLTQIYPNTVSLMRATRPNGNYIKPGGSLIVPLATDPYAGFEYVVSPPSGRAMVVAVLSPEPVQILDLPDIPPNITNQSDALAFLTKSASELRIPEGNASQLREARWSFDAKVYTIQ
jgi:hypothetical protein